MEADESIWRTDAATLRDVVLDPNAMEARLGGCTELERVWVLSLLGRHEEAVIEGQALLAASKDRFQALLVLANAYQRMYRWHDAAKLQEQALRLSRTRTREANVRHQIGRRLFDEGLYRDAAAEFDWAASLFGAAGRVEAARSSRQARDRALEVHRQASFGDNEIQACAEGTGQPESGPEGDLLR
ncbi:hypothetical protein [Arthrobacter sp. 4R501]|uniref:hypothetical protein n=1 Tax=Arthrobacter sp. 4R501 TaxID=2058886 RepID=UPI0015E425F6|nr:hypothetical protein [Arthrobacter sp. 4R501]